MRKTLHLFALLALTLPLAADASSNFDHLCTYAMECKANPNLCNAIPESLLFELDVACGTLMFSGIDRPEPPFPFTHNAPPRTRTIPHCENGSRPLGVTCGNAYPVSCIWYCMENGVVELRPLR
ncbi:MAG TPA: hypothetical protein VJB82_00055 [Candidatus Peribacterales bacterium]|nr:hypothetical protein [Candidatus Peribacterales bacterium]